jgi:hypothetical protein
LKQPLDLDEWEYPRVYLMQQNLVQSSPKE